MKIITIDKSNIDQEHICCAIGNDKQNQNRYQSNEIKKLENYKEAQEIGCPSRTLGIYYNGVFKTHELMPEKKFEAFIEKIKI